MMTQEKNKITIPVLAGEATKNLLKSHIAKKPQNSWLHNNSHILSVAIHYLAIPPVCSISFWCKSIIFAIAKLRII
jgi:hypothetical protein